MGRQSLEGKIVEETSYFSDAIREHKEAFDINVSSASLSI